MAKYVVHPETVNHQLCNDIQRTFHGALGFNGQTKQDAIDILQLRFFGQHMTTTDVQHLYKVDPAFARYYECGVCTMINFEAR